MNHYEGQHSCPDCLFLSFIFVPYTKSTGKALREKKADFIQIYQPSSNLSIYSIIIKCNVSLSPKYFSVLNLSPLHMACICRMKIRRIYNLSISLKPIFLLITRFSGHHTPKNDPVYWKWVFLSTRHP